MPGGGRLRSSSPCSAPAGAIILFCSGGAPDGAAARGAPGPPRPPCGSPGPTFLLSSGRLSSCPSPRGPLGGRRAGAASGASCCAATTGESGISVGEPASAVEKSAAGSAALERRNVTAFMIPSLSQVNTVQPTRPRTVPVAEREAALAVMPPTLSPPLSPPLPPLPLSSMLAGLRTQSNRGLFEMKARVKWVEGMAFTAELGTGHAIVLDGAPRAAGATSASGRWNSLLMGLAGCTAFDVVSILRRGRDRIEDASSRSRPSVLPRTRRSLRASTCTTPDRGRPFRPEGRTGHRALEGEVLLGLDHARAGRRIDPSLDGRISDPPPTGRKRAAPSRAGDGDPPQFRR